jgi:hypothetical protein
MSLIKSFHSLNLISSTFSPIGRMMVAIFGRRSDRRISSGTEGRIITLYLCVRLSLSNWEIARLL